MSDLYERAKEKLLVAENTSDITAGEGTEDEMKRCEKEKKSRYMRAKKHNSSSECEFDSDNSQDQTKLKSFPKIPVQIYDINSKQNVIANQKRVSSSLSIEQSILNKPCQISRCQTNPVIRTKASHKEATISSCTGQKYYDKSSDENDNWQDSNTQKHTNKSTESKNVITAENGL